MEARASSLKAVVYGLKKTRTLVGEIPLPPSAPLLKKILGSDTTFSNTWVGAPVLLAL